MSHYFTPITGNIYLQQPAEKVNYQFTTDEKGLWLWSDENHKLFFSEEVLSVEENELQKAISIYPNPAKKEFFIELKNNSFNIT